MCSATKLSVTAGMVPRERKEITDLPFSLYSTFVVEARHGFNKQTIWLFFKDMVKGICLAVILGPPIVSAIIVIVQRHARSEKLLDEGRLKTMLNTDGKIEEEETPALYARILANSQGMPRKKSKREEKKVSRKKRMRYGAKEGYVHPNGIG